jgi:adenine-specific DNA-methyltransferase
VQIGDENVHRVRAVMDEVFGADNFSGNIIIQKGGGLGSSGLKRTTDYILWYAKNLESLKYRDSGASGSGFLRFLCISRPSIA